MVVVAVAVAEYRQAVQAGAVAVAGTAVAEGARKCWQYWLAEGDAGMASDAEARLWRVLGGTDEEADVLGALDWLDA